VIAPDWRGYGLTTADPVDNYWFADYMADLDFLLDHYAPGQQVNLVGHSMGGNVVMLYSGVRPERIRRLVNLEGFGGPGGTAEGTPARYAKWIDELKEFHRGDMALKSYSSADGVARRLMKTNKRLGQDKADWLARHWARAVKQADGSECWEIMGDPAHKITFAQAMRADDILALYGRISAPTLAVEASDNSLEFWWKGRFGLADYHERLKSVANCRIGHIADAGHMLHHDQPEQLARLIEEFLA
jgi:pimeloyl-ACP methyl ester carboxylesterase